ncbi:hypothetical protein [Geoalkalibacter halelectricus]|uniref:hypothetical protein n=1 Tax=Geoalkalibacter halelectricus TaxID=2847045 RepID=UPI00266F450C|nr:hypothetical protein [Geoalkalibacter halelectricus]MDO3380417.1 hypothetical protein [Geoalkalibacter halelectricus]
MSTLKQEIHSDNMDSISPDAFRDYQYCLLVARMESYETSEHYLLDEHGYALI